MRGQGRGEMEVLTWGWGQGVFRPGINEENYLVFMAEKCSLETLWFKCDKDLLDYSTQTEEFPGVL